MPNRSLRLAAFPRGEGLWFAVSDRQLCPTVTKTSPRLYPGRTDRRRLTMDSAAALRPTAGFPRARTEGSSMQIRVGYELIYDCPQPTPMLLIVNIHYSRASDIVVPD